MLFVNALPQIPQVTTNWVELVSQDNNNRFTPRNSHASCVFQGKIWVVGGRTDTYTTYNFASSYRVGDVWYSTDGIDWTQVTELTGDYWAQNADAVQPGPLAPWYARFGHTLTPIDSNEDNNADMMVLAGGYSPAPSNDIWVTENGINWVFAGNAPWSPRAWHGAATFNNSLWIVGGSPLNNEVWRLVKIVRVDQPPNPLTRSMKANVTYSMEWQQYPNAPFAPRAGFGLLSHFYFNQTQQPYTEAVKSLVVIGGYGGWPEGTSQYDGTHGWNDVWKTTNGETWLLVTSNAAFGPRAWFGVAKMHALDARLDIIASTTHKPGRILVFGGGDLGFRINSQKQYSSVNGQMDAYWSRDLLTWTQINYQEGGSIHSPGTPSYASRSVPQYSSQEWTRISSDSAAAAGSVTYTGVWGMSVVSFNTSSKTQYPGQLYLIGGLRVGSSGSRSNSIYRSDKGLLCDFHGVSCSYRGVCGEANAGCVCEATFSGDYCEHSLAVSAATPTALFRLQNQGTLLLSYFSLGVMVVGWLVSCS